MDSLSDLRRQASGTNGRGPMRSSRAARHGGGGTVTGSPGCCGALRAAETLAKAECSRLRRSLALGLGRVLRCLLDDDKNYCSDLWKHEIYIQYIN